MANHSKKRARPHGNQLPSWRPSAGSASGKLHAAGAFTLLEVLVVIAIIAILAALLLPSLSEAKSKSTLAACRNNLKQLVTGVHLYAADNDGYLPDNRPKPENTNSWVEGDMTLAQDATNQQFIVQGGLFPYASAVPTYRCPADPSRVGGAVRLRSYSMNGWLGSRRMESVRREPRYRTFVRDTELALAGAATIWVQMDEHEGTINDGWFEVTMDDSHPFASFPAMRHQRGYGLNFADGHVELYKLRDPSTQLPANPQAVVSASNSDWLRLKQITTVR